MEPLDVVIPCHPKDAEILPYALRSLRKNCKDVGTIYVISSEKPCHAPDIEYTWVPESAFPFTWVDVFEIIEISGRTGWYLQQLFKLYAPQAIPMLSSSFLAWDADCILCKPTAFRTADGVLLFDLGYQYHPPYFQHAERVLGRDQFRRMFPTESEISGITDHMVFSNVILTDLLSRISARAGGVPAWRALLDAIDDDNKRTSGMSEFELYFHFTFQHYPDAYYIRPLLRVGLYSLNGTQKISETIATYHSWARSDS